MFKTLRERSMIDVQIGFLLSTFNSSVNVVIYCFRNEHFREVAIQIIRLNRFCRRAVKEELPLEVKEKTINNAEVIKLRKEKKSCD